MRTITRTIGTLFAAAALAVAIAPAAGATSLTQAPAGTHLNTAANLLPQRHDPDRDRDHRDHDGHRYHDDICFSYEYDYFYYCNPWGYDHDGGGHWDHDPRNSTV